MNENNFRADQYLLHYGQHQLLQSTDPSLNAVNAELCDAMRRKRSYKVYNDPNRSFVFVVIE